MQLQKDSEEKRKREGKRGEKKTKRRKVELLDNYQATEEKQNWKIHAETAQSSLHNTKNYYFVAENIPERLGSEVVQMLSKQVT